MPGPKRKIKAMELVQDLRKGMGDEDLMKKYEVSPNQFQKVLSKLVEAGLIDEMELFMRTSLTDSTVTKAFVDTQLAMNELDDEPPAAAPREVDPKAVVEITQVINLEDKGLKEVLARLGKAIK
jgi:Mor family transcriptional regulator